MKSFIDYFNEKDIIFYLCRIRAKYAKKKNRKHLIHLLTKDEKYNHHNISINQLSDYEIEFQTTLFKLLPSRRKWKDLDEKSRYKKNSNQKLSSYDKNIASLINSINIYKKKEPNSEFLKYLNLFIKDIQESIKKIDFEFSKPIIYPKVKNKKRLINLMEGEKNICRPISLFKLKDRLILSFTNKYLTDLFDQYFEDNSLAFRATKIVNGDKNLVSHHTAIQRIIEIKNQFKDIPLWVAECDIKKFYDSINHDFIIDKFNFLIDKVISENNEIDLSLPRNIFIKYLDCYSFNNNVLKYNLDDEYWKNNCISRGEFGWIEKDLLDLEYYTDISNENIGIPQGGALSGLIANLVLDNIDKKVSSITDLKYIRFCDDMIMISKDPKVCGLGLKVFQEALKELKLIPHKISNDLKSNRLKPSKYLPKVSLAPFWKSKSKGPFKWDDVKNDGFPWIGFVGYEIHYKSYIRVRKSSLENELKKQREVVRIITSAISIGKRKRNGFIAESAIHRLIGMSVGRVEIWNCNDIDNEMCWITGFRELNNNKYSIRQLKNLDRSRSKLFYNLIKDLNSVKDIELTKKRSRSKQIIGYNKPFSYYFHGIERKNK